jgi:uncharacterized membrane protein
MTTTPSSGSEPGRGAAFIVYVLYLLSIPSLAVFALLGVIVALVSRDGSGPLARAHLDDQVRFWFVAFWWALGVAVACLFGWILTVVLIGFPILMLAWIAALIVGIWFTVKSLLGLLKLLDNRPPR